MKKLLTLLFISFLFNTIDAQNLNLKIGITNSYQTIEHNDAEFKYNRIFNPGLTAGLNIDFSLQKNWMLSPGVFFVTKGFAEKIVLYPYPLPSTKTTPSEEQSFEFYHKLFYIEFPVMIKKNFNLTDTADLYLGFGPYVAFKLGACTKAEKCDEGAYLNSRYKTFDTGLSVETGFIFSHKYIVSLGYSYGLINMGNNIVNGYDYSTTRIMAKNRYWSFQVGYKFAK